MSSVNVHIDQSDCFCFHIKREKCKERVKAHQHMIRLAIVTGQHHELEPMMDSLEQAQLELESTYSQ